MKILFKFRLLSLIIIYAIFLSCNNQQNKSASVDNYEKIDYYSDSINTVRIDNISLTTINVLNNDYVLGHSRIPLQTGLPTYIYILGLILLSIITALIVHYRKKDQRVNLANLNNDSLELLESELNQEELMLFKKIFFAAPEYISFPELMTIYDQDLTYDSLKKKLRHSLTEIEKKSQILLKINRNIFEERRSVEDKRIKCIRIMP